tara:strand:+ start:4076 stop:4930 length:855 start_codon:yes stop_codon:yes gene_type:complete
MAIKLGNTNINVFGNNWIKAYLGNTLVLGSAVTEFISLWETTTPNETITLPITAGNTWDWGDGTINQENSHEYTDAGQYTIKTSDSVVGFRFNNTGDKDKILNISSWGMLSIRFSSFYGASNLDVTATDVPSPESTVLPSVFRDCTSLVWNSSVNNLDVSLATNLAAFFEKCDLFNQSVSSWDTSNVQEFSRTFRSATSFNQDVSSWDFSSTTNLNDFMGIKSSTNYDAVYYDNLLIKWDSQLVFSGFIDVNIGMGSIKYTAAGATARASLVGKGFVVSDGGLL